MNKKAVIVAGGTTGNLNEHQSLLKNADVIIGVDGGAVALLEAGVRVDVAIGDFDSISAENLQLLKDKAEKVIELPAEKDLTDTEAALEYAAQQLEVDTIFMLGLFGGRVDHMMSNLWVAYHPDFQGIIEKVVMIDEANTLSFYRPGSYHVHKEEDKKYLSFISMTAVEDLRLSGVKYSLDGKDFDHPIALVSNEFLDKEMNFSFAAGLIAMVQSKDINKKRS